MKQTGDMYICGLGTTRYIHEQQLMSGATYDSPDAILPNEHEVIQAHISMTNLTRNLPLPAHPDVIQVRYSVYRLIDLILFNSRLQ